MKATLEFNLPEEQEAHMDAINGTAWRSAYQDIRNQVRNSIKYGHSFKSPDEVLDWVFNSMIKEVCDIESY